jgi:hypothetical protein
MEASGWLVCVEAIIFYVLSVTIAKEGQFVNMVICKKAPNLEAYRKNDARD